MRPTITPWTNTGNIGVALMGDFNHPWAGETLDFRAHGDARRKLV